MLCLLFCLQVTLDHDDDDDDAVDVVV